MNKSTILNLIEGQIIVSCQAEPDEPLGKPEILAALAETVVAGGAAGIRAESPPNIRAMKARLDVPVIGIYKKHYAGSEVFITPTVQEIDAIAQTGVEILAMDATLRKRPGKNKLEDLVRHVRDHYDVLIMADISTVEEGVQAARLGFDLIGTTLSGYTSYTMHRRGEPESPDFELIRGLKKEPGITVPVIAEGRIWNPDHAVRAYAEGAFSIVIGSSITRPHLITKRFVNAVVSRNQAVSS